VLATCAASYDACGGRRLVDAIRAARLIDPNAADDLSF